MRTRTRVRKTSKKTSAIPMPPPAQSGPPPVHEWLMRGPRNRDLDWEYVLVPTRVAAGMPAEWQERFVALVDEMLHSTASAPWPMYRVSACQSKPMPQCNAAELAQHGYVAELDCLHGTVFRPLVGGARVENPQRHVLPVDTVDPITGREPYWARP